MTNEITINNLIRQLSDKDGQVREKARLALADIGKEATLPLTALLTDKDKQTRWEAAKALGTTADPAAIPALVQALNDEVFDVRWLISEALVKIGEPAIIPVLEMLTTGAEKLFLREEARHVLKYIIRNNPNNRELIDTLKPVTNALEDNTAGVSAPAAAKIAIAKMKKLPETGSGV